MQTKISDAEFEDYASGSKLYGDNFSLSQIESWYRNEEHASFDIYQGVDTTQYDELNWYYAFSHLSSNFYDKCVALGIADGKDIEPFASNIGELIGIEPEERWWRTKIGNTHATYLKPKFDGTLPMESNSCDLSLAFSVLHHIPNVSYVVSELARVIKKDGVAVFREPVTMMGDFRFPRTRMSPHERGIPPLLFRKIMHDAGLKIERWAEFDNPLVNRLSQFLISKPYNNKIIVRFDRIISRLFIWNMHYFPKNIFQKIAPSSIFIIARKIS